MLKDDEGMILRDNVYGTVDEDALRRDFSVNAAPPRLYDEMFKPFFSGEGARCYDLLRQTGLFATFFPGFPAWLAAESEGFPHIRFV